MRLLVISMLVAGCAGTHSTFPSNWRIVDLTHVLAPDVPTYMGAPGMESKTLATVEKQGVYINEVTLLEHVGTHVDAPAHFVKDGVAIDRVPVEKLVLEAAVIDVSAAAAKNPDYALTVDDLQRWEQRHGSLSAKHIVVVHTGWGARWPDPARYRNPDDQGVMHFPGVSVEASRMLRARGVAAIGIDTLSADPGAVKAFDAHKDFLGGGGYHVENLANTDKLPEAGAVIAVAPLPLRGGSGSPARVIAFVPER
jgi:kynurenine formamidase